MPKTSNKAPNFSEAQEQRIRDTQPHNAESAALLAREFDKSNRSVIAKMTRMEDVVYNRKLPTTKSGDPVTSKADLVAAIGEIVSGNLDGLEKAPKPALFALRDHLAA